LPTIIEEINKEDKVLNITRSYEGGGVAYFKDRKATPSCATFMIKNSGFANHLNKDIRRMPNRADLFDFVFLLAAVNAGTDDLALLLGFANKVGFFVSPLPVTNIMGRMFCGGNVHLS
jgi:hypothetical protein